MSRKCEDESAAPADVKGNSRLEASDCVRKRFKVNSSRVLGSAVCWNFTLSLMLEVVLKLQVAFDRLEDTNGTI